MKNFMTVPQKPKNKLQYDTAIMLLGIYLEKKQNTNSRRCMYPNIHSNTIVNQ